MKKIFEGVAGNNPKLNRFDLSYTNTTSMKFGLLYPVQCDEVYPGDVFKMSAFCHAEVQPLVAPLMSDIQLFAHSFFVPYRLIYGVDKEDGKSIWEKFITGGEDGDYDTALPSWSPNWTATGFSSGKIWDYIGNPVSMTVDNTDPDNPVTEWTPLVPDGLMVSIAPKYAYNFIYNEYYRDENLVSEVALTNEDLLKVAFKKDYFTSALEYQQRGTAPALPVDLSGTLPVLFSGYSHAAQSWNNYSTVGIDSGTGADSDKLFASTMDGNGNYINASTGVKGSVNASGISATTFTVSDLRLAFAIQRLQELSMRSGYRYTEFLGAHYGVNPTDARLDRPEYIGGAIMNINVSPLIQTSATENRSGSAKTPQGNKTGVGHIDSIQKIGNYRVLEHGLIMTVVSIRPKPIYQQGINRQWLRQDRFSFYIPEEAFLSEQNIYNAELYVDGTSDDADIFGYQAHWNELRCKNNIVTGAVREQFDYWVTSRKFDSRPHLNQDFIEIVHDDFSKIFAVEDEDSFIVSWSNIIDAYRPIPAMGVPGLIDHVYGGF